MNTSNKKPEYYMKQAIGLAMQSDKDLPIAALIVKDGEIIAKAHNLKEKNNDALAHAEMLAIKEASNTLGTWRLNDCDMYVTLEPCPMCAWAILNSRIKNVYFGAYDSNYGAMGSRLQLKELLFSKISIYGGILEQECNQILRSYFEGIRK